MPARRRAADTWTAVAAGAITALVAAAVAGGRVSTVEEAVFRFVNGWPDAWRWPLWSVQLLGVLGVPLVVAAVAAAFRRWRLAAGLVLLVPLKLLVERAVLKELVHRERPGTTVPDAILRGDEVNAIGQSFPSGHAIIAFGVAVLLLPYLHRRRPVVLVLVLLLAVLNGISRIYLGAHLPLDVVAGAAAGVGVAALLNLLVGVPLEPRTAPRIGSVDRKERRWHSG